MEKICHIVGGGDFYPEHFKALHDDFIIAADAGYEYLKKLGISPDITVGDFDSLGFVPDVPRIALPVEKDDTDTGYAAKLAFEKGFRRFELHGCTGGRFDHTIANIQSAANLARLGCIVVIHDQNIDYLVVSSSTISFDDKASGTISIFAHANKATISISGLKYELDNAEIDPFFPLGVSNSFIAQKSMITVHSGTIIVITPSDSAPKISL